MVEYPYEEGLALLQKNLAGATKSLESLNSDLAFLKDQITISEVNIARVHNRNVKYRQDKGLVGRPLVSSVSSAPASSANGSSSALVG